MRLRTLAQLSSLLLLAACQSQQPIVTAAQPMPATGSAYGIDIATDSSDVLNELKGGRINFVARYYRRPDSRWPTLTAAEANRLSSLGLKIVTVWEAYSHNPLYFSYGTGYYDATSAYRQAKAVGQPAGSAIYFAVDFDARGEKYEPVDQYFRGVAAGMAAAGGGRPQYRIGVYGSGFVCDSVKRARLAELTWLSNSTAWTGSSSYFDWNIKQGRRYATLSGINHDANEARDEFGAFQLAGSPPDTVLSAARTPVVATATSAVATAASTTTIATAAVPTKAAAPAATTAVAAVAAEPHDIASPQPEPAGSSFLSNLLPKL